MRYHCTACSFTQFYLLAPRACRLCGRSGTMAQGAPPTPGYSIAHGLVFENATGRARPLETPEPLELQSDLEEDDVAPERRCPYLLFHTLGACTANDHSGDGAYSAWMVSQFSSPDLYCRGAHRLEHPGGNSPDLRALAAKFEREVADKLEEWSAIEAPLVILNWHVRFTGRPNSWTGRGIDGELMRALGELCTARDRTLRIVYTIHEYARGQSLGLSHPDALIALNPQVQSDLAGDFPEVPVYRSRVPNLEETALTGIVDRIRAFLPDAPSGSPGARGQDLGVAHVMRELGKTEARLRGEGPLAHNLALFGSITGRHGLSRASVGRLLEALDGGGVGNQVQVCIAGRVTDRDLAKQLQGINSPRVRYLGEVAGLDFTLGCRYAISFDPLGFRDNASAMVNMIRAGTLLFCRRQDEVDGALCLRVARTIAACERLEGNYLEVLALQQPLFQEMSAFLVASRLDAIFALHPG